MWWLRRARNLGDKISQFIPAHPIAGAEKSGAAAALADLYQGKKVVLTPLPENSAAIGGARAPCVGVVRRRGERIDAAAAR